MSKKFVFIVNPIAGSGRGKELMAQIENYHAKKHETIVEVLASEYPKHASNMAKKALKRNPDAIIAVGGDGTINEIANSLVDTKVPLGIIPIGSGNGLARHLQIPHEFLKAMKVIDLYKIKKMDTGIINDRYFFCTTGTGFDARVGNLFAQNPHRGFRSYANAVFKEFFKYKPKKYKLNIDGVKIKERAFILTFANASQYGNNAYIAPLASTSDGLIDISILKPFPLMKAVGLAYKLFHKKIHESRYVKVYRGKKITVKRKKSGDVHIDGEPLIMGKKLSIEILPKKLRVIIP
ncbi:MAG: YegS/Rv2252/BmrU family lipid kinase [Bacteroidetes bacterium]|nr:YegS/Rv2252/BmrU family lipid kinase [Bacteroidota bacterium]